MESRQLVPPDISSIGLWFPGTLVPWDTGSLGHWFPRTLVPQEISSLYRNTQIHKVLDICCQQLENVVQLGGVCVPFEHRVGGCKDLFRGTYVLGNYCPRELLSQGTNVLRELMSREIMSQGTNVLGTNVLGNQCPRELLSQGTNVLRELNVPRNNKGIRDAGSTADIRMLWPWSALICLGLLQSALDAA